MRISDWSSDVCSSDLRHHQHARFQLRLKAQRNVHGHLVTIEVRVESGADQRVKLDGLALNQHGFECLDAKTVKRRGAVQHDRVLANRSEEHTSELQSLMRISYAVFCLKKNKNQNLCLNEQGRALVYMK